MRRRGGRLALLFHLGDTPAENGFASTSAGDSKRGHEEREEHKGALRAQASAAAGRLGALGALRVQSSIRHGGLHQIGFVLAASLAGAQRHSRAFGAGPHPALSRKRERVQESLRELRALGAFGVKSSFSCSGLRPIGFALAGAAP